MTAKKCTKKRDVRAKSLFCLINPFGFLTFSLPLSLLKVPNINVPNINVPNVNVPTRSALVLTLKIRLFHSLQI